MRFVNENHMCSTAKLAYVHLHLRYNVFAKPQFLSMHIAYTPLNLSICYRCIVQLHNNNTGNDNDNGYRTRVIEIYTELWCIPA